MVDACGCCEAPVVPTPMAIQNRPGLPAIAYRVGTYASFRQAMLEAIARSPALSGWTTRRSDDYGIALLEMWAYLADILTFYQERIANESFLRTARQRDSILRLAALLDYQLRPGVAAKSHLAFTLEKGNQVQIPIGLRVQSVPGQDEKPQKFETVEALMAKANLDLFRVYPQPESDNPLVVGRTFATVIDNFSHLASGEKLVVFTESTSDVHVEDKQIKALRTVDWRHELEWAPAIRSDFASGAKIHKWLRKFRLFGHNAPAHYLSPTTNTSTVTWETKDYSYNRPIGKTINLDAIYDDLKENTELLVVSDNAVIHVTVTHTMQVADAISPTDGVPLLQASVTQVTVTPDVPVELDARLTVVYELQGPTVELWDKKYVPEIVGTAIYAPLAELGIEGAEASDFLSPGRRLLLEDKAGVAGSATVVNCTANGDHLQIEITPASSRPLDTASARVRGNLALATHGETVKNEVLGNGDAAQVFQRFPLKKKPVTFVPSPSAPNGAANTLQVMVDQVRWREVTSLYGQAPTDRIFITRMADDGTMTVQFGDGVTGARLSSGRNNTVAVYRQGIGQEGNVAAGKLTTLLDRPVGMKAVTNPQPAAGGTDPESMDDARTNAPTTVRTFDRAVSLRDFEDLARSFAGVAKARATWVWNGEEQVIHLTVAGENGADITGATYDNLVAYLKARRDPNRLLQVASYVSVPISVAAVITVDPNYVASVVKAASETAVLAALGFDGLNLGQSIHLSDLYAILQGVEGVIYVDVDKFRRLDVANAPVLQEHIAIYLGQPGAGQITPAELATLQAADLTISVSGGLPG